MTTLICCNGRPPSENLLRQALSESRLIIGADGGAVTLIEHGAEPDFITGDMDSFPADAGFVPQKSKLIPDADQETNDLEKALKLASGQGATRVLIVGGSGFRLDHTLKNLSVMQRFDSAFERVLLVDDFCITTVLPKDFSLRISVGTPVSLFPLSGRVEGVSTSGLRYALDNEFLENGIRDGSSNEAVSEEVTVRYRTGALLLMIPTTWPLPF